MNEDVLFECNHCYTIYCFEELEKTFDGFSFNYT